MAAPPSEELAFSGVTLARFAAVRAALAEPFVLRRVLAVEELRLDAFQAADIEWKRRLSRDAKGLMPLYQAELAAAEDWLMRIVSPLHEDVEAWVDFQCAFALHPAEVLKTSGLGMNDISRLTRFWQEQAKKDSLLAERADDRRRRGAPAVPRISAGPRQLRRSRAAAAAGGAPFIEAARPAEAPAIATPRAAEISAEPAPVHVEVPSFMVAQASPVMAPPVIAPPPMAPPVMAPPPVMEPPPMVAPQRPGPSRPPIEPAEAGGTQDVSAFLAGPALPFAPQQSAPPEVPAQRASAPPPVAPPMASPPAATADLSLPQYASLCVDLGRSAGGPAEVLARYRLTAEAKKAIDRRYRERFTADPALFGEFRKACDAYQTWLSERASGERSSGPPSVRRQPAAQPAPPTPAAAPAPTPAAASAPALTVEQYAALRVDLQIAPQYRAATLKNYGLTEAQSAALDAAWGRRLASDPAAHAAYQRAAAAHSTFRARGSR